MIERASGGELGRYATHSWPCCDILLLALTDLSLCLGITKPYSQFKTNHPVGLRIQMDLWAWNLCQNRTLWTSIQDEEGSEPLFDDVGRKGYSKGAKSSDFDTEEDAIEPKVHRRRRKEGGGMSGMEIKKKIFHLSRRHLISGPQRGLVLLR